MGGTSFKVSAFRDASTYLYSLDGKILIEPKFSSITILRLRASVPPSNMSLRFVLLREKHNLRRSDGSINLIPKKLK
jgi:hypothetical protein